MPIEDANKKREREAAARMADKYCDKEGGPPDARETLAGLDYVEYGKRRSELAEELGITREFLDLEYRERRKEAKAAAPAPTSFIAKDLEPWDEPVDGDAMLDELVLTINKHLVTQDGAAEVAALWAVFTHSLDCFHIAPILGVTSPVPECGKTTFLTLLREVVHRPLKASNLTAAVTFRAIDKWAPTLLVDEADTFLKDNEELRGVINSGHRRGDFVLRNVGDQHEPQCFSTWSAKAIALVGKLQPSLASRSIHIEMRRKRAADKVTELRMDRLGHLVPLHRRIARWAKDNAKALREADPALPAGVHGRAADNWRPLLAIADAAGGEWPERARDIAVALSGRATEDSYGVLLLEDLGRLFAESGVTRMSSVAICEALAKIEERPWAEYHNDKPITQPKLATLLKPFGIVPTTVRLDSGGVAKGYKLERLRDTISRYTSSPAIPPESAVTTLQGLETKDICEDFAVTSGGDVTAKKWQKPRKGNGCNGVTAEKGVSPGGEIPEPPTQAPTTGSNPLDELEIPGFLKRRPS